MLPGVVVSQEDRWMNEDRYDAYVGLDVHKDTIVVAVASQTAESRSSEGRSPITRSPCDDWSSGCGSGFLLGPVGPVLSATRTAVALQLAADRAPVHAQAPRGLRLTQLELGVIKLNLVSLSLGELRVTAHDCLSSRRLMTMRGYRNSLFTPAASRYRCRYKLNSGGTIARKLHKFLFYWREE